MKRKKIVFFVNSIYTYGGEQRVGVEIMNALCEKYDIVAITKEKTSQKQVYKINKNVKIYSFPYFKKNTLVNYIRIIIRRLHYYFGIFNNKYLVKYYIWASNQKDYYDKLIGFIKQEEADFVVGLSGKYCVLLDRISKECDAKTITWMHNSYEAYFETPKRYYWNQDYLFKRILPHLDKCIVLNDYISRKYKESFNIDCEVIYNPRSFVSEKKVELKKKQFIASARMVYAKGFDLLIESFELFCKYNTEWRLVILGDGEEKKALQKRVEKAGLEGRVTFTGFTSDVQKYMLDSSIFLLTSRWEGFPMVITEALELGLPIIAYDITAMEPLVTDGKEGILVEAFNTVKYADAMLELARDKEKQLQMSVNGIKKAEQLSIQKIVAQWEELLESL